MDLGRGWDEQSLVLLAALSTRLAGAGPQLDDRQTIFGPPHGLGPVHWDTSPSLLSAPPSYRSLGKPLGSTFLALSLVYLILGVTRFFHVQDKLTQGLFPASRFSIGFSTIATAGVTTAAFVAVLLST